MAFTRRARFLECFYCGRKSSIRYNGQQSFECRSCDATNYLDENGDITDPPAAAVGASTPAKVTYAVSRTLSPPKPSGSIFCETCLSNQRLFTASLAQYLPDDPDAPDYAEREKQYYEFRKRLEKLYPQICAECEPKVRQRIEQAAYTAKTDVLRRMIDQSKTNKIATKRSSLDGFLLVGRWLWIAGFALELLSHVLGLSLPGLQYCASREGAPRGCSLLTAFALPLLRTLPEQGHLLRWSLYAGLLSCWWNPRFVQTVRGFTKHLVGLRNWYIYQMMAVGIRLFSMRFFGDVESRAMSTATEFGAHLLLITFALITLRFATTCIRVDTTPLFGAKTKIQPIQTESPQTVGRIQQPTKPDGVKNMADLLDEILESPTLSSRPFPRSQPQPTQPAVGNNWGAGLHSTSSARKPNIDFNELFLSDHLGQSTHRNSGGPPSPPTPSLAQAAAEYEEEMDWSPSASQHRAFSSYRQPGPASSQGFGQAPTEEEKGAFWFRVPPAPVPPAHRLLNPPNQPRLRTIPPPPPYSGITTNSHYRPEAAISFRAAARADARTVKPTADDVEDDVAAAAAAAGRREEEVAFARPSFFPPASGDDPRNGLAELLQGSFSLRQRNEESTEKKSWIGGLFGGKK